MNIDPRLLMDALCADMARGATEQHITDSVQVLSSMSSDRVACQAYSRHVRDVASSVMAELARRMDVEALGRVSDAIYRIICLNCTDDFDSYMLRMEWNRSESARFYQPRRRVLLPVVMDLQDLFDSRITFLGVSMPPRVGKSTICIFFLTFMMGNDPESCSLMVGYNDDLAKSFWNEAVSIVTDSESYCFNVIFPHAPFVAKSAEHNQVSLASDGRYKTLTCASVEAGLTGRVEVGPGGLLYCDDLVKKRSDAVNPRIMDKLYTAYLNQVKDRTLPGARFLMVGTRWVPNDPAGRVKDRYRGNPMYRFTTLPALDGNGDSNFMYDRSGSAVPFDRAYYEDMRDDLIEAGEEDSWSAKYMCEPFYREGLLFGEDELRYYDSLPEGEPDCISAVCDTKTKGPDYCVQVIAARYGDDHYVVDVVCSDSVMDAITPELSRRLADNRADMARYESNVAGSAIAKEVERGCSDLGYPMVIETKYSTANKETRIEADSGWVKKRCLFRSPSLRDAEYERFMRFLTTYTAKGKNAHDDVPDAMSMYKRFAEASAVMEVEVFDRPW